MNPKRLQLENFRNYPSLDLELAPVTALIGDNAQGKTNVLEALAFLALGKSCRGSRSRDVITWGADVGRIRAKVAREDKPLDTILEIQFQRAPELKRFKRDEGFQTPKEWIGQVRAVLFTPDHLDLVTGSPALRRQFLDRLLLQISPVYLDALQRLHKILEERNALLKLFHLSRQNEAQLDIWDEALVKVSQTIWEKRREFLHALRESLTSDYQIIAGTQEKLTCSSQNHEDRFGDRLAAAREHDMHTGSTSVGPHRDDFLLQLGGRPLAEIGSRGECRSAVLALKMAELHHLTQKTGEKPLLLLDDVFSELDSQRQAHLSDLVQNHPTVLTTTALEHIQAWPNALCYQVEAGQIRRHEAKPASAKAVSAATPKIHRKIAQNVVQ